MLAFREPTYVQIRRPALKSQRCFKNLDTICKKLAESAVYLGGSMNTQMSLRRDLANGARRAQWECSTIPRRLTTQAFCSILAWATTGMILVDLRLRGAIAPDPMWSEKLTYEGFARYVDGGYYSVVTGLVYTYSCFKGQSYRWFGSATYVVVAGILSY